MAIGLLYGLAERKLGYPAGVAAWGVFPLSIAIDVSRAPTSHNLFPIELVAEGALCVPALAAAAAAAGVRRLWRTRLTNDASAYRHGDKRNRTWGAKAIEGTRTLDLGFTKASLYRLSYDGTVTAGGTSYRPADRPARPAS